MPFVSFLLQAWIMGMLLSQGAFASVREEGGGGMDGGGGGTFVSCSNSKHIIFLDLLESYFSIEAMEGHREGDKISLSPSGLQRRGEWLDPAALSKSTKFMEERFQKWKPALRFLTRALTKIEKAEGRGTKLLATNYSIQAVREVSRSYFDSATCDNAIAIPGAFFNYDSGVAFLDINVWNQATLHSQAAMLFHERMRLLQRYYPEFSNNELQEIVMQVMTFDPARKEIVPADQKFHPKRSLKAPRLREVPEAQDLILEAVSQGVLGDQRGDQPLHATGDRNGVEDIGGEVTIEPLNCERRVRELRARNSLTGTLKCEKGEIVGQGSMLFPMQLNFEFDIDLRIALLTDGAQVDAEILKVGREGRGLHFTFTRKGQQVEVRIGSKQPVIRYVEVPRFKDLNTFKIALSKASRNIQVILNPHYEFGENRLIAEVPLPKVRVPLRSNPPKAWKLTIGENTQLQYIRVIDAEDVP